MSAKTLDVKKKFSCSRKRKAVPSLSRGWTTRPPEVVKGASVKFKGGLISVACPLTLATPGREASEGKAPREVRAKAKGTVKSPFSLSWLVFIKYFLIQLIWWLRIVLKQTIYHNFAIISLI